MKPLQNKFSDAHTSSERPPCTQGSVRDSWNGRGKELRDIRDFQSSPALSTARGGCLGRFAARGAAGAAAEVPRHLPNRSKQFF